MELRASREVPTIAEGPPCECRTKIFWMPKSLITQAGYKYQNRDRIVHIHEPSIGINRAHLGINRHHFGFDFCW